MKVTVSAMGGVQKAAYEHMKALAGELESVAAVEHAENLHPGTLGTCTSPMCVHWVKLIRWAGHIEMCREMADYARQNATYDEIVAGACEAVPPVQQK